MSKHTVHFVWDMNKVYWIILWPKNGIMRPNCIKKYDKNRLSSKNVVICIDIFQRITFLGYFQVIVSSLYQFIYFACILRKLKILSLEGKPMERVYLTDTDSLLLVFDRSPFSDSSSCDCSSQTFTIWRFKRSIEAHATLYATTIGLNSGVFCEIIIFDYLKATFW